MKIVNVERATDYSLTGAAFSGILSLVFSVVWLLGYMTTFPTMQYIGMMGLIFCGSLFLSAVTISLCLTIFVLIRGL